MAPLWDFSESVPKERRRRLLAVQSFDEVIDRLETGEVVSFHLEPRDNPPYGCCRAFFTLRVGEEDYDAFFNSPVGYRAQYCVSPAHGASENRRLLDALLAKCMDYVNKKSTGQDPDLASASLRGADAKVWIKEADLPNVDEIQVRYPPWAAKVRAADSGTVADQAARASAHAGVMAPVGTLLEIKGGWIDSQGKDYYDPAKSNRSKEIHDYGFS